MATTPQAPGGRAQRAAGERSPVNRVDVLTLFPGLFEPFLKESMVGIAVREGLLEVAVHDLRGWTHDKHRTVDDTPYGGGPGMVMKAEPLVAAIEDLRGEDGWVVLLSPQGAPLRQAGLRALGAREHLVLVCGRYEGIDQRAIDLAVDEEVSIGDYVLSGGEVPAMAVIEGICRLIPGVLGNPESTSTESFETGLLEGPQYTRPADFRGLRVPDVLRSGDHGAIARWRAEQARERTRKRRPDLLRAAKATAETEKRES